MKLRTKLILATITLDLFAVLLGGATALLPVFAQDILHVGPADYGWLRAAPAGGGRVGSWTVLHPPVLPAFADLVPFVVLLVELDEGVRMVGQLVGDDGIPLRTDGRIPIGDLTARTS